MQIEISGHRHIADEFDALPKVAQRIVVRAVNRGIDAGNTLMARAIAKDTAIKVGDVKKSLRMSRATLANPSARLAASLNRIPLIRFNARGTEPSRGRGRGVSYKLQGSRGRVAAAFVATMKSGHRGVFVRKTHGQGSKRLPIQELAGPSIGAVFAKYRAAGLERAREVFTSTVDHDIAYRKAQA